MNEVVAKEQPPKQRGSSRQVTSPLCSGPLDVRAIDLRAGSVNILQGVGLQLHPGELCALIGPSGAGKSSLIKVLLGLRKPKSGTVRLGAEKISKAGPIGYVPQDDALHRSLTVNQALTFAARLRLPEASEGQRQKRVTEVLRQVGLRERRKLRVKKLSGGQRKRVSLALELLTEPPLMILDEPTSGLDPGLEARMMSLFADIAHSGRIVLVATHAMQSLRMCNALMVLVQGHTAFFGEPEGALEFFDTKGFRGIFDEIPKKKPAAWAKGFLGSDLRRRFAARPAPEIVTEAKKSARVEDRGEP